jgi:calcineurin-like phosphoesterase family protein
MTWFFTSDQHLGHKNLLVRGLRSFATVEDMDTTILDEWNKTVSPKDTVVTLGDFSMEGKYDDLRYKYIRHLHGNIIWIKGNHDSGWMKPSKVPFPIRHVWHKQIREGGRRKGEKGPYLACSHYPMRSWNRSQYGSFNLHGHCHGTIEPWKNQMDVGIDSAYKITGVFRPFELDEIIKIIEITNRGAKDHDYHTAYDD